MKLKVSYSLQAVAGEFQISLSTEAVDKNVGKPAVADLSKPLAQIFYFVLATEIYTSFLLKQWLMYVLRFRYRPQPCRAAIEPLSVYLSLIHI